MTTVFGIPNCDTVKKTRRWLADSHVDYSFHDYKKSGIDEKKLKEWAKVVGWETLLNRRGTTWRKLPETVRDNINEASAIKLMAEQPSMIKRPVLVTGDHIHVGFSEDTYKALLI